MKGRTLIRQFSTENQTIPFRRKTTVEMLKEKIAEVDALLELDVKNQSYITIKDELVHELAASELRINALQERMTILNQVAEYLLDSVEKKQEMKLKFSKLNIAELVSFEQVNEEVKILQEELGIHLEEYKELVKRLEMFVKVLETSEDLDKKFKTELLL